MTKAKKVYTVSPIPGRGMALIATTAIPVGKRIIGEKPVVSLTDGEKIADKAHLFTNCAMSLANSYPDHPDVVGIFYTNCIGRPGSDRISDLCVRISRANHSCRPSAMYSWNDSLQKEVLYAVRPIWEGDEITVEYNAHTDDFDADRQHLFDTWGFQCDCRMCMEATPSYKEMYNRYPSVIEDIL
ncbi:SET domain-containing protein, partial [Rhizoclosmatium globosum]